MIGLHKDDETLPIQVPTVHYFKQYGSAQFTILETHFVNMWI